MIVVILFIIESGKVIFDEGLFVKGDKLFKCVGVC